MDDFEILLDALENIANVQSGIAAAAGNVTINEVVIGKTVVISRSKGSGGYVAARGDITLTVPSSTTWDNSAQPRPGGSSSGSPPYPTYSGPITGGSTDLTVKEYSARLVNSTTIYCDGPVEWQVLRIG